MASSPARPTRAASEDAPLRESLYPDKRVIDGIHDHDKILVERAALSGALPGTIVRLPMVYGPATSSIGSSSISSAWTMVVR